MEVNGAISLNIAGETYETFLKNVVLLKKGKKKSLDRVETVLEFYDKLGVEKKSLKFEMHSNDCDALRKILVKENEKI